MQPQSRLPDTLAELFSLSAGEQGIAVPTLSPAERSKLSSALKGRQRLALGDVEKEVRNAYRGALDVNLMDIFLQGWTKISAIAAFANAHKYPPGERHLVPLAEHRITSHHEPRLEILVDGIASLTLPLEVMLRAEFEGAVLEIGSGCIQAVKSASCRATGSIAFRGVSIASMRTGNLVLPAEVKLQPAFSLRASASDVDADEKHGLTLSGFDKQGQLLQFRLAPKLDAKEAAWLVGRHQSRVDFVIPDKAVSAEHARIRFSPSKGLEICDLDSSNGTRVDGKLIDRSYVSLMNARKVTFGFFEMQVARG